MEGLVSKLEIEFEGSHGVVAEGASATNQEARGEEASVKKLMKRLGLK